MGFVRAAAAGILRTVIRPFGGNLQLIREDVPGPRGTGTGIEYWSEGLEHRTLRWWALTWRGRVVMRMRSDRNRRAYWRRRRDLIRLIDEMRSCALLPQLHSGSHVFEPGCNVAQNLWEISRRWNCEIHGLDIDREALDQAAKRPWPKPAHFVHGNVLEPGTFAEFSDGQFDLVFTRWHLIHVPAGEAKQQYVRELKRIGRGGGNLGADGPREDGNSRVGPREDLLSVLGRLGGVVRPQAFCAGSPDSLYGRFLLVGR